MSLPAADLTESKISHLLCPNPYNCKEEDQSEIPKEILKFLRTFVKATDFNGSRRYFDSTTRKNQEGIPVFSCCEACALVAVRYLPVSNKKYNMAIVYNSSDITGRQGVSVDAVLSDEDEQYVMDMLGLVAIRHLNAEEDDSCSIPANDMTDASEIVAGSSIASKSVSTSASSRTSKTTTSKNESEKKKAQLPSLSVLLENEPIDWKLVKQRISNEKYSHGRGFRKNMLHKLCLVESIPPEMVEWAITNFASTQLSYKSGILGEDHHQTPLEICLHADSVSASTLQVVLKATIKHAKAPIPYHHMTDIFDLSSDKLAVLFDHIPSLEDFMSEIHDYLEEPLYDDWLDFLDDSSYLVMLSAARQHYELDHLLFQKQPSSFSVDTISFLVPHTILVYLLNYTWREYNKAGPSEILNILQKTYEGGFASHFGCADAMGRTLLHLIVEEAIDNIALRDDEEEDYEDEIEHFCNLRYADWERLLAFLVYVDPCMCTRQDTKGRTPLHIALEKGLPECMTLVLKDCCQIATLEGFYPYQIAATAKFVEDRNDDLNNDFDSDCPCDYCTTRRNHSRAIFVSDGPFPGSTIVMHLDGSPDEDGNHAKVQKIDHALTRTFELLRAAPHVLSNSISQIARAAIGSDELLDQICRQEMEIAHLNRLHFEKIQILKDKTALLKLELQKQREEEDDDA